MSVKFTVTFTNNEAGAVEPFHFTQYAGNGTANSSFDVDRTGTANTRPTDTNALLNAQGYIRFKQFQRHLAQLAPSHSLVVTTSGLENGEVGKSVAADIALAGQVSTFTATVVVDDISALVERYDPTVHGNDTPPTGPDAAINDWEINNPAITPADAIVRVPPVRTASEAYIEKAGAGKVYRNFGSTQTNDAPFEEQTFVGDAEYGLRWDPTVGEMVRFEEVPASTSGWIELPEFSAGYTAQEIAQAAAVLSYELTLDLDDPITEREAILVEVDTARDWDATNGGTVTLAPRAYVDMRDVTSPASPASTIVFEQYWR